MAIAAERRDGVRPVTYAGTERAQTMAAPGQRVSVLTGGGDIHYAIPLSIALASRRLRVDVIGSSQFLSSSEFREANLHFLNGHGNMDSAKPLYQKVLRVLKEYTFLFQYAARTDSDTFHILWHNKFKLLDHFVLTSYYKLLGKKLIFTAHNVDVGARDGGGGRVSKAALRHMYRLMDHIFVHTRKMKTALQEGFDVPAEKVTVIPFGVNTVPPRTELSRAAAREQLGIGHDEKVALFFGNIAPYKGLDVLVDAVGQLKQQGTTDLKLLIVGNVKGNRAMPYWESIESRIDAYGLKDHVRKEIRYVREDEVEVFFKAADVCVLPYVFIFQSGVLFLSYRYGVPAVVTDAGSMAEDVIEGRTGFVCRASDIADLGRALLEAFNSDLLVNRERTRADIITFSEAKYSWESITATIANVYQSVGRSTATA